MKVADFLGMPSDPRTFLPSKDIPNGHFIGIEIELEGIFEKSYFNYLTYWATDSDGSLRNGGLEVKYSRPLCGEDINHSIKELYDKIEEYDRLAFNRIRLSERCATHMHLDVIQYDQKQLVDLIVFLIIFEKSLFRLTGIEREKSQYCIPIYNNKSLLKNIGLIGSKPFISKELFMTSKYSNINLESISKFGSIELRSFRSTLDPAELLSWIRVVLKIKEAAKFTSVPLTNFPAHVSETGFDVFLESIFGDDADLFMYPGYQSDLMNGIRTAQDIISAQGLIDYEENMISNRMKRVKADKKTNILIEYSNKHQIPLEEIE